MTEIKVNNRYANGKIYKLENDIDDLIYVGSTCDSLCNRKCGHGKTSRRNPHFKVYKHINAIGGWQHVRIILVEKYPCESKEELLQRENYWYHKLGATLNMRTPGQNEICEHDKQRIHCKDCNGSQICEHGKQRHACKDCKGSGTIKVKCECGSEIRKDYMLRHLKTKKHRDFIAKINI
jgi:hypothetical protein